MTPDVSPGVQPQRALGSRYLLDRVLGTGAMGEVWVAVDQRTGERVAAKLLRTEHTRDAVIVGRFVQERAILLDLAHPNIVRVRDLVVEGEDLAIVMDLVEGSDLRQRLREEGTFSPQAAVRTTALVLDALAAAHARGVLHRDVKPDNVLLGPGDPPQVLLSDFSIARLAQETTVRMTGVLGTAEYIAPEVFTAEVISAAADVYGTGVLLYELLAGRTPFAGGGSGYAVAHRHVNSRPPELPGLPAPLAALLPSLLAKDPSRRPTAAGAAAALRALLPELADAEALPQQPAPSVWEQAGDEPGAALGVLSGAARTADLDPGQTTVRGSAPAPPVSVPVPGLAGPLAPLAPHDGLDAQVLDGQTQLRAPAAPRPAPLAVPEDPAAPARTWRTDRRVWAAAAAVVVLAAGGGAFALTRGGDAGPAKEEVEAATTSADDVVTADLPLESAPTGLITQRSASYDTAKRVLTTSVTWKAGSTPLSGPLFEAVPPLTPGGACPDPAWSVSALPDTSPEVSPSSCGYRVDVAGLPAQGDVVATYALPWRPKAGEDVGGALRARLTAAAEATRAALDGLTATDVYAPQRLDRLEVRVDGVPKVGSPISLTVLPVWAGTDEPDNVDVLFSSRSVRPGALLGQLGGKLSIGSDDCSGSIAFTRGAPYANTPGRGCTITVRIGTLESSSSPFDVVQNSAGR